jgi:hypothetical protein
MVSQAYMRGSTCSSFPANTALSGCHQTVPEPITHYNILSLQLLSELRYLSD